MRRHLHMLEHEHGLTVPNEGFYSALGVVGIVATIIFICWLAGWI